MKKNRPELDKAEKKESYSDYYKMKPAEIPSDVLRDIHIGPYPEELALPFNQINDLLEPGYLTMETGYCHKADGSVFVAVITQMPKVTGTMLDWWFWWHPIHSLRYKIWYPEAHFGTALDVDMETYARRKGPYDKRYWNTTNYPVEDIGIGRETLSIKFVPPEEFGFDGSRFAEANVATAVCGVVGSVSKRVKQHTVMCHFVRNTERGVEMRSRFWIGQKILVSGFSERSIVTRIINTRTTRKLFIPQRVGQVMAMHCAQEYNNLARILPDLYETYGTIGSPQAPVDFSQS